MMTNLAAANSRFVGVVCDICSLSATGALGQYHSFIHSFIIIISLQSYYRSIDIARSANQRALPFLAVSIAPLTKLVGRIGT